VKSVVSWSLVGLFLACGDNARRGGGGGIVSCSGTPVEQFGAGQYCFMQGGGAELPSPAQPSAVKYRGTSMTNIG
jgi:hypothetical protein